MDTQAADATQAADDTCGFSRNSSCEDAEVDTHVAV